MSKRTYIALISILTCFVVAGAAWHHTHKMDETKGVTVHRYVVKDLIVKNYPDHHYCIEEKKGSNITTSTDCEGKVGEKTWTIRDGTIHVRMWGKGDGFTITTWDKNPRTLKKGETARGLLSFSGDVRATDSRSLMATVQEKDGFIIVTEVASGKDSRSITERKYAKSELAPGETRSLGHLFRVEVVDHNGRTRTLVSLEETRVSSKPKE